MIELKNGSTYSVYNDITPDSWTWNTLNSTTVKNNYGMQELRFQIDKSALKGADDSYSATLEILNKYRVIFDKQSFIA